MGFTLYYRSTRPVSPEEAASVEQAANELSQGRTWLSCQPINFFASDDDYMFGGSKPNFDPSPVDAAAAAKEDLPDGMTSDLIDILCELSRAHAIDWEISHDYSDGPLGYIRRGVCDDEVLAQCEAFAGVVGMLGDILDEFEPPTETPLASFRPRQSDLDDDQDEPPILKFRPKRE